MRRLVLPSLLAICAACSSGDDDAPDRPDAPEPPANRAPAFTGSAQIEARENTKETGAVLTAEDADGDDVAFAIVGGADADAFVLGGDRLSFAERLDFEAPGDADGDNVYEVEIEASDGAAATQQTFTVTLTDGPDGKLTRGSVLRVSTVPVRLPDLDGDGFAEVSFERTNPAIIGRGVALAASEEPVIAQDMPTDGRGVQLEGYAGRPILGFDVIGGGQADVITYVTFTDELEDNDVTAFVILADTGALDAADDDGVFDFGAAVEAAGEDGVLTFETAPNGTDSPRQPFAVRRAAGDQKASIGFRLQGRGYLIGAADLPVLQAESPFLVPSVGTEIVPTEQDGGSFFPVGDIDADGLTDFAFSSQNTGDDASLVFGEALPASGTVGFGALRTTKFTMQFGGDRSRLRSVELDGEDGDDLVLVDEPIVLFSDALTEARGGTLRSEDVPGSGDGYRVSAAAITEAVDLNGDGIAEIVVSSSEDVSGVPAGTPVQVSLVIDGAAAARDADGIIDVPSVVQNGDGVPIVYPAPSVGDAERLTADFTALGDVDGDGTDDLAVQLSYERPRPTFGSRRLTQEYYIVSGRAIGEALVVGEAVVLD